MGVAPCPAESPGSNRIDFLSRSQGQTHPFVCAHLYQNLSPYDFTPVTRPHQNLYPLSTHSCSFLTPQRAWRISKLQEENLSATSCMFLDTYWAPSSRGMGSQSLATGELGGS